MASLFDKAKQAAQQALDEAKKGIDTGQAKLDEVQVKRDSERLLTALGAAFYAEQRQGGSREGVSRALSAVDAHVKEHGMVGFPAAAVTPDAGATPPPPSPTSPPAPADTASPPPPPRDAEGSAYDVPPTS